MPIDMTFPNLANLHITCDKKVYFIIGVANHPEYGAIPKAGFTFGDNREDAVAHIPPDEIAIMRNMICIDLVEHLKDLSLWLMADDVINNYIDKKGSEK